MEYLEIFAPLLPMVATLLTVALMPVAVFAAKWLRTKLGAEKLVSDEVIQTIYRDLSEDAIAYVEQWAANLSKEGKLPPSSAKLSTAVNWVAEEALRRGLPERSGELIAKLIEARLGRAKPTPSAMREVVSVAPPPMPGAQ